MWVHLLRHQLAPIPYSLSQNNTLLVWMIECTDEQMDKRSTKQTQVNEQKTEQTQANEQNEQTNRTNERNEQTNE